MKKITLDELATSLKKDLNNIDEKLKKIDSIDTRLISIEGKLDSFALKTQVQAINLKLIKVEKKVGLEGI